MTERVHHSWRVPREMHGLRADQCLQRTIGRISRARAARIIFAEDFLIDDTAVKLSLRVKEGQKATLFRFAPDEVHDVEQFDVKIIYEDKALLVVNKPCGMSIHPSANCLYKTLTHWLRIHYPQQKINPCHRIDKETSGLVVCAKDRKTEGRIKSMFMHGQIRKTYLAVVLGHLKKSVLIDKPLEVQGDRGLVAIRMIEERKGKPAKTRVRPAFYHSGQHRTLVVCKPYTGRQHQIRAHLSMIGHGIVGDKLYSYGEEFFDAWCKRQIDETTLEHPRHALHAYSLRFLLGGQKYVFRAPIPQDFPGLLL